MWHEYHHNLFVDPVCLSLTPGIFIRMQGLKRYAYIADKYKPVEEEGPIHEKVLNRCRGQKYMICIFFTLNGDALYTWIYLECYDPGYLIAKS